MAYSLHFAQPIAYYLSGGIALFAFVALAVVPSRRTREAAFEVAFLLSACAALFVCRWPVIFWPHQMNPDESGMIACALKAMVDIVPWRGFDAGTSGPLNCDVLLIPALFGAPLGYVSARMTGLCLIAGAVAALYYTVKWIYGASIARLAVVAPVLLLAITKFGDFVSYSSELLSIFLTTVVLAAAAYLVRGAGARSSRLIACATSGLCLGCAAFAKLQAAPLVLAVLVAGVAAIRITPARLSTDKRMEAFVMLASLLAVPLAMLITLCATGGLADAIIPYFKMAFVYVGLKPPVGVSFFFVSAREYPAFLLCSLVIMLTGAIALAWRPHIPRIGIWASLSSVLLFLASVFAIYQAHRPFPHYLLFSVIPVSFCVANVLGLMRPGNLPIDRKVLPRALFIGWFLIPIAIIALNSPAGLDLKAFPPMSKEVQAVSRYVKAGDRMVVWGWSADYYVKTSTIMSTRDSGIWALVEPGPYREYFRERFMSDLRKNPPRAVVDTVAPGAFSYDNRATHGIETFPPLDTFVQEHYLLREEVAGVRIFVAK